MSAGSVPDFSAASAPPPPPSIWNWQVGPGASAQLFINYSAVLRMESNPLLSMRLFFSLPSIVESRA